MTAQIGVYYSVAEYIEDGTIDVNSDVFKATLHDPSFVLNLAAHTVYANLSGELPTAAGYTVGGQTLNGISLVRTANQAVWTFNPVIWTASGTDLSALWMVIRKSGTANGRVDPLIAAIMLDASAVTAFAGYPLTVTPPAGGLLTFFTPSGLS